MTVERRRFDPRTERAKWLAWRKEALVTGSTLGALWDCHPFISRFKLYQQARGAEFPDKETSVMRRGRLLEPAAVAAVLEERPDWSLAFDSSFYFDPELRAGATPDRFIYAVGHDGFGILEIKNTNRQTFEDIWQQGTVCPLYVDLQIQLGAMLTGAQFGAAAVLLVEPYDVTCHVIDVPLGRFGEIRERITAFAADVAEGREPTPEFEKDADTIKQIAPPEQKGRILDLTGNNNVPYLLERRSDIRDRIKRDEADVSVIESELRYLMGEAEQIMGLPGWRVTWKTQHRKGYTVEPSSPRVLLIHDRRESQ